MTGELKLHGYLCLFRPDRVKALVNMGVPSRPQSPVKPVDFMTKIYGEGFYVSQFQVSKSRSRVSTIVVNDQPIP